MNRKIPACIVSISILLLSLGYFGLKGQNISDKLIRFHVIANSDSQEDQSLKLKVRDSVLKEVGPLIENSSSRDESENILRDNLSLIKSAAEKEIAQSGKNQNVSVILGKSSFPTKMYSTIALPAGEYEALKVIIGEGQGKNWWCVMFPPLCFVDVTKGITSEDTEDRLKTVLSSDEYNGILNNNSESRINGPVKKPIGEAHSETFKNTEKDKQKIELRFKSIEIGKAVMVKLENMFGKNKEE